MYTQFLPVFPTPVCPITITFSGLCLEYRLNLQMDEMGDNPEVMVSVKKRREKFLYSSSQVVRNPRKYTLEPFYICRNIIQKMYVQINENGKWRRYFFNDEKSHF